MRLDVTQLSAHWPQIAAAIQASTPDGFDKNQVISPTVFQSLVAGQIHVWGVQAMRETPQIAMWVLTRWITDPMTGFRHLSIFSLHAYETIPDDGMRSVLLTLIKFAQGGGANALSALTSNPRLIGLAQTFGADTSQRLVSWNVADAINGGGV